MKYEDIEHQVREAVELIYQCKPKFGQAFESCAAAKQLAQLRLGMLEHEAFMVMFLNSKNELILDQIMFNGTINAAAVYPREIAKRALELNASNIVLAHNHPSGNPEPSDSDIRLTKDIKQIMSMLDIDVLDHIIVASDREVSLAQRCLM